MKYENNSVAAVAVEEEVEEEGEGQRTRDPLRFRYASSSLICHDFFEDSVA